ncbi:transporter substrate-binding domain-containing protein [Halobacteriovorax sp. JY17]|uniref:substrate-binding periplasmic protein n=1 Tax=Halobacteriovorax sp. JY17 TaxID=2014617 RepID=UPI0025B86F3B|nr:transporter substrate-binding domain-containing protein [Halobacteriovorax sp. JY17]
MGTTVSMPPYLNEEKFTGIEIDLIKNAFMNQGIKEFKHVDSSFKRAIKLLVENRVDAIITNGSNTYYSDFKNIYPSHTILNYVDCVISLKSSKEEFKKPSDIIGKRVWAFKSAKKSLGQEFARAAGLTAEYNESIDQLLQPKALLKGRMDFAISDRNIFFTQALKDKIDLNLFRVFNLSSKTPRVLRFHSKKLRDLFNNGLSNIRKNGTYELILAKYKDQYKSTCN